MDAKPVSEEGDKLGHSLLVQLARIDQRPVNGDDLLDGQPEVVDAAGDLACCQVVCGVLCEALVKQGQLSGVLVVLQIDVSAVGVVAVVVAVCIVVVVVVIVVVVVVVTVVVLAAVVAIVALAVVLLLLLVAVIVLELATACACVRTGVAGVER